MIRESRGILTIWFSRTFPEFDSNSIVVVAVVSSFKKVFIYFFLIILFLLAFCLKIAGGKKNKTLIWQYYTAFEIAITYTSFQLDKISALFENCRGGKIPEEERIIKSFCTETIVVVVWSPRGRPWKTQTAICAQSAAAFVGIANAGKFSSIC